MKLLSQREFHQAAHAGRARGVGVRRIASFTPKAYSDGSRKIRFCFSDGSVDRMGDTIDPNGWDVAAFQRNPVCLFAHDSSSPPIGRASNLAITNDRLMGDIEFATAETYCFADTVYRLCKEGYISAVSVGFLPIDYDYVRNDPDREFGIDFKRQELIEISIVPVPANANALVDARAAGHDTTPLALWAARSIRHGNPALTTQQLKGLGLAALGRRGPGSGGGDQVDLLRWARTRRRELDDERPTGNCGRPESEPCGMVDPKQCAVHCDLDDLGPEDGDSKAGLLRLVRRLRGRVDPRLIAADAAFRLRRW
jgi:HK97 family phage prohead protease